jgi:shikimate dehydrogenase
LGDEAEIALASSVSNPSGTTKQLKKRKVLLLGAGISKSISPELNNKAYRELGLDMEYSLCEIPEDSFDSKLEELVGDERVLGFNVTIPFKEKIISHLNWLDPVARIIGAVNLVVISADRKKLSGYNTDVDGVVASLSKLGLIGHSGQVAVILGAGGAARACVYALLSNGFDKIRILNRSEKRARELASSFSKYFPEKGIVCFGLTSGDLETALPDADLLVNTIPIAVQIPFEVSFVSAQNKIKYLDLNYRKNPPILRAAKRDGVPSIDGALMLVEQAARSFEILTGISAPRKTMMLAAKRQSSH